MHRMGLTNSRAANWLSKGPPAYMARPIYQRIELLLWTTRVQRVLVPHLVKQRVVKGYAAQYGLDTLIETGTYLGDMIWGVRRAFRAIHSVELDPSLYERAVRRFRGQGHVHLYLGDSAVLIGEIVAG